MRAALNAVLLVLGAAGGGLFGVLFVAVGTGGIHGEVGLFDVWERWLSEEATLGALYASFVIAPLWGMIFGVGLMRSVLRLFARDRVAPWQLSLGFRVLVAVVACFCATLVGLEALGLLQERGLKPRQETVGEVTLVLVASTYVPGVRHLVTLLRHRMRRDRTLEAPT